MDERIEVDLYVCGQHRGRRTIGANSIVGRLLSGQDAGRRIGQMVDELNAIPGVEASASIAADTDQKAPDWDDPNFHPYDCRCSECLRWWRDNGPDPFAGGYGPFSAEEIEGARVTCPDCGAEIPADGACWYCENDPVTDVERL